MGFQIHALQRSEFEHFFAMSDEELSIAGGLRVTANESPGYPCRVSLADAEIGEQLILVNYKHLPEKSPYSSSHAVFVREQAQESHPAPNDVPKVLSRRLLSVRAFSDRHLMIDADVVDGTSLSERLNQMLQDTVVDYIHIHNAKQGCFAARATRV